MAKVRAVGRLSGRPASAPPSPYLCCPLHHALRAASGRDTARACSYMAVHDLAPGLLKLWVPAVIGGAAVVTVAAEIRIWFGFTFGI